MAKSGRWLPGCRRSLTDPQKNDATNYEPGDLLQFHENAPGHKKGSRLVVADGDKPPVQYAERFEVYRPAELALAVRDRIRVTVNGWTKDGKHRLSNGALFTVQGFTRQGDVIVDNGWVIGRDFGHLTTAMRDLARGPREDREQSFYRPVEPIVRCDQPAELLRAGDTRQGTGGDFHRR